MAKPRTLSFGKFTISISGGDSPDNWIAPCGFTQKALSIDSETSDFNLVDCDSPEAPAWVTRAVTALSASVTGQGVMAMASLATWRNWALSGLEKNIRVTIDDTLANGGGYWQGPAILQTLGNSVALGSDGNKTQQSVSMVSSGEWTWTDAAA
jgi:hypothetical protein